jgi:SPP1 gp7 family putative phage head morphogenesis protein
VLDDTWLAPFPAQAGGVAKLGKIVLARPDAMRPIIKDGELQGWELMQKTGRRLLLLPEQVIVVRDWNPYDETRNVGDMETAELAAETDHAAAVFARNLMLNNGDKGPIISAKTPLSDEQVKQITEQLRMKRDMARRGNFAPVILTGDVEVQDPSIQAPDATFATNRLYNRHEIFIAFGVPASMADVVASYSVGSASDRFRLIEDTCMPISVQIAAAIGELATRQRGAETSARFVWDEHSVMQQVRRERIQAATAMWDKGIPWTVINRWMSLGLPRFEGDDTAYLPFSVAPVGQPSSVESSPAYAEPSGPAGQANDATAQLAAAFRFRTAAKRKEKMTAADAALWREHMSRRRKVIADYEGRVSRWIFDIRAEVLGKLEHAKTGKSAITRGAAADFIFDLKKAAGQFDAAMRRAGESALETAGRQLLKDELGKDDPWRMAEPEVLEFLDSRQNKMSGVPDEVHKTIMDALSDGIDAGESIDTLQARIRTTCNGLSRSTAQRIAMTETAAAYGTARQAAMEDAGVSRKRWLTSGNDNVRPAHEAANGQEVGIDEPFVVDGEELDHPGDEHGSPANVINCHCISIPVK